MMWAGAEASGAMGATGAQSSGGAVSCERVLAALEPAACLLLSPPSLMTTDRLKEAEAIFQDFRKIPSPYQLCKEILETSSNEYILFETAGLLKIALVKEWSTINAEDIQVLKNYLLQYVAHKRLPPSVREKILQVLSIIVKWQSLEDGGASRHALVQEAKSLIVSGGDQSALGCSLLSAVLQEHTSNARRSDNLSSDKRQQIRRQFECTDLFDISSFGIQTLQEIVERGALNNQDDIIFAEKLLQLVRTALCWGQLTLMLPALLFDSDRKEQSEAWTALITNDKFFITLGVLGRNGEPLLSPVLSCLEQLTYVIAGCSEMDKENALRLARALFPLLGVAPSPAPATALRRLVINHSRHLLSLPPNEFLQFLTTLLAYIEHLIRLSALEEAHTAVGTDEEDGWRMGLEAALEAWVELLHVAAPQLLTSRPPKPIPQPFIEGSAHIFDALLKTRLAAPDGTRHAGAENEAEIEEEGSDIERYNNLLSLAGALGRAAPEHSIPLLCRLLEARTNRMQELFIIGIESQELCCIYEDLHWTILFTAHVLTQDGEGEIPAIPGKLVHHSVRVPGDLLASERLLASPEAPSSPDDMQAANTTIRLIAGIWRMCWIAGWGMGRWVASPTLGASVTWFLRRWARAYWLPDNSCAVVSGKPGPVLQAIWGRGSPRDVWAAQRLSSGALAILRSLPGDPAPAHHAISLLRTVASINCQEGSTGMVHVWEAVKWGIGSDGVGLSEEARRGLAAAASAAVSALPEDQQSTHLNDLLTPIHIALTSPSSSSAYLQALDIYTGLAEGCKPKSSISIWKILEPAVAASVQGLREGGAITRSTLRLAAACVAYLSQTVLNYSGGLLLLHIIDVLRAYSTKPILQFSNAAHAEDAEDDYCEETMLVMEIISELVAKGYNDSMESGNKEGMAAVLEGIRVILPRMMSPTPLLQRPNVAKRYYRLIFDFGPDIICPLEDQYFNAVMRSIADGLDAASDEDAILMCKLLGNLGRQANGTIIGASRLLDALPSLANRLLSAAATGALQAHIEFAASTYYCLACYLQNMQLPSELATIMKSDVPPMRLKTAFTKYFSHLQTLNSV